MSRKPPQRSPGPSRDSLSLSCPRCGAEPERPCPPTCENSPEFATEEDGETDGEG